MKPKKLPIRPYARLLTMLGEQLIKNEKIALVELIKNSYDADADWVEVRFENFNDDMSANENSSIVIRDNGHGMTYEDIKNSWMNPATPQKYKRKKDSQKRKTLNKKRVIQGEKGIGRFAILKLGKTVTVATKTRNSKFESVIEYDFAKFDDDFISENGKERDIFLDEIKIDYSEFAPPKRVETSQGTMIEIRDLKGVWSRGLIKEILKDVFSLTDPVSRITENISDDFEISIFCNGEPEAVEDGNTQILRELIDDKAVFKIQGRFSTRRNSFIYKGCKGQKIREEIKLEDSKIRGLWIWRQEFRNKADELNRKYRCGNFKFNFYIFDFSLGKSGKHQLKKDERRILRDHRIYLYRDNVRVYPYGDPDDDWLRIDVDRGVGKAGDFFSNDQVIGWIDISQEQNPRLRDKTNREGLIEKGTAVSDFIFLIRTFLSYVRQYPYSRYQEKKRTKNTTEIVRSKVVTNRLYDLKTKLVEKGYKPEVQKVAKIEKEYIQERDYLVQRAEITEDLAGVGLSVEMTSHDIMLMMGRANDIARELARSSRRDSSYEKIRQRIDMLLGVIAQITESMRDVQSLFRSAKRRKKNLKIEPVLDKIYELYKSLLEKKGIEYEKFTFSGSPLVADTTDGVVMQVLINLFDNASYWLDTVNSTDKKIYVTVDGTGGELIFSDNGPGIDEEDLPYIFEPFYSGKGQEGRGLGLYIARQLLERHDYNIYIARENQAELPGANFVVSFNKEDS